MRNIITIIVLLFSFSSVLAQDIKGKITDAFKQPLEDVYIFNASTNSHAHSLPNGTFILLNNKVGDTLNLGLLGFKKQTIVVSKQHVEQGLEVALESKTLMLEELVIKEQLNPVNTITKIDVATTPVNSSQEILRKVPGLIIGQHAGGGKAEQLFLRGFDIDHGTDISINVDGMPVNMVSHAHGQGYSDLHFVIPETINEIDFGKGPYYGKQGDFNTAGYVDFSTKDHLKESTIKLSAGQFNSLKTLAMFNLLEDKLDQNAYLAAEYLESDGPFESPQNFNRLNLFGKYVMYTPDNNKLSLTASHFTSRWDASGQIPQREVDNGNITRFGAIDDTEGGNTHRTNFNLEYNKYMSDNTKLKTNAFYSHYAFELYSNFTFFLEDPINGDQIKQKEDRHIFGVNTEITKDLSLGNLPLSLTSGIGLRHDVVNDVELSKTLNKTTIIENVQLGDINQTNIDAFVSAEVALGKLTINPALRFDYFKFLYNDKLQPALNTQSETKAIVSPKLNFFYDAKDNLQLFVKSGIGFHSNDTRVVVAQSGEDILPRAYGVDVGNIWKPFSKLIVNSALWYLFSEQEFVYVGDAGIVEPSGESERYGLDLGLRYQLNDWLFLDTDATFTHARSVEEADGENYIPLAPDFTMAGGLSVKDIKGFSGGIRYRFIDDRPANEDNSIVAEGYFVTDFNVNYTFSDITLGLVIENLFDVDWNETQFATESRLQNEAQPVEEIHFTPGTPFFIKGSISYSF
ncbi:TonB-dependent receptor [Lacinutrix gracilariae]|uniref:TonB-dependent receptor n=1 Tax=Lacinutrix gracilariae TaxID=1747198 RepID=A0ABW5JZZ8_9FLAO